MAKNDIFYDSADVWPAFPMRSGKSKDDAPGRDYLYATDSRKTQLHDNPHYSNSYWNKARTIFGCRQEGLSYDYSDRLREWDYRKADTSFQKAISEMKTRSADFYERYLTLYYEKPIELLHVMAGVNLSNGYPYLVFGYRVRKAATPNE